MKYHQALPGSAQIAYSELLANLVASPLSSKGVSYFTRTVKGKDYWYMQYVIGSKKSSVYIGPDNEETKKVISQAKDLQEKNKADQSIRKRLVATGIASGLKAPNIAEARVLEALTQAGLFEAGCVLVGSQAFIHIGNMLGIEWNTEATKTEDVDIAQQFEFNIGAPNLSIDLVDVLRQADKSAFPVPALNPKHPSTNFKLRNQNLTVSILTPEIGKPAKGPVILSGLNIAAEPIRFMDYLLEDSQLAAVFSGSGLLIRVPHPARFALHKLVVSQRRPIAMAAKSQKDLLQANSVLEVLKILRPGDVEFALDAAKEVGGKFIQQMKSAAKLLDKENFELLDI